MHLEFNGQKVNEIYVAAGKLQICTLQEFIEELTNKHEREIADIMAEHELLDAVADTDVSDIVENPILNHKQPFSFVEYGEDDPWEDVSTVELQRIQLKEVETPINEFLGDWFLSMIPFRDMEDTSWIEIAEELSRHVLEDFGDPTHFIFIEDGVYAVVDIKDFKIKTIVHDGKIKCGIIPLKRRCLNGARIMK